MHYSKVQGLEILRFTSSTLSSMMNNFVGLRNMSIKIENGDSDGW